MSQQTVIRVEQLSKKYILQHQATRSGEGLRHIMHDALTRPFRALKGGIPGRDAITATPYSSKNQSGDFYALRDVSFDIKRGEVVGIVGRNGAGKSTLLKILSRITEPTSGRVGIKGRVASLLEVGTGFHPELSGRENIFLNGAILGMSRAEVKRKFDEIVSFAGVERFLDTPVKRYSSGMYVRLGFAVAAHLEPEILVIDEVLAVGDAEFQKKCLGKIRNVARDGRTVFFVSHNLSAISSLCDSGIYLVSGTLKAHGPVEGIAEMYMADIASKQASSARRSLSSSKRHIVSIHPQSDRFPGRRELRFDVEIEHGGDSSQCQMSLHIMNRYNVNVATLSTEYLIGSMIHPDASIVEAVLRFPHLAPGLYRLDAFLHDVGGIIDKWEDACRFEVSELVANEKYTARSSHNCGVTLSDFDLNGL